MKWMELIRVRSSRASLEHALPRVRERVQQLEQSASVETFFLRHALYDGDLAVVVVWRNDETPHKTRAGMMLADDLLRLGSVDHAVWIPVSA